MTVTLRPVRRQKNMQALTDKPAPADPGPGSVLVVIHCATASAPLM